MCSMRPQGTAQELEMRRQIATRIAFARQGCSGSGRGHRRHPHIGLPMEKGPAGGRAGGADRPTPSGTPPPTRPRTEAGTGGGPASRSPGGRAFPPTCGPGLGSPRSLKPILASSLIPVMSGTSYETWAGAPRNRSSGLGNARKQPSGAGGASAGLRPKKPAKMEGASSFWTEAASGFTLGCVAPGRLAGRHLGSTVGSDMTGSR